MEIFYFVQIAAAVIVGNFFSAMGVYFAYRVSRHEKINGTTDGLPPWIFLVGLAPFSVVIGALLLMP